MERNKRGEPAVYLGDGAYAVFEVGGTFRVYTSDGIEETNNVYLEPDAALALVLFFAECGFELPARQSHEPLRTDR